MMVGSYASTEWPRHGLEWVGACPVCGISQHFILHEGLRDHAFETAPGAWRLMGCTACGSAYLDPRPDRVTIGLAYGKYFTHVQVGGARDKSPFAMLRRRVANSYLNRRYGMGLREVLPGGYFIAQLFPRSRAFLDVSFARHLDRAPARGGRLLDVGCGNGAFLELANGLGWLAEGVEPDPNAVIAARAIGCTVTAGTLDSLELESGVYDHITLSHVIEHVHDPARTLRQCFDLLAPGGRLWLETPNLNSFGHKVFGRDWRGLEPPRHLVLFTPESLAAALGRAGFVGIESRSHPGVAGYMWEQSRMIRGKAVTEGAARKASVCAARFGAPVAELVASLRACQSEFLTFIAFRPRVSARE